MKDELVFTAPVTPLMKTPEMAGEIADEALHGMTASIVGEEKGLFRVRMRYRYEGYIAPDSAARTPSADEWEAAASFRVIAPAADVMAEPAYRGHILLTLPRGALLAAGHPIADESGFETGWLQAALADGTAGYVRSQSVRPARTWAAETESETRGNIVADARRYLGAQYRWGGKSHFGIDCSGLAAMSYMLNGLYIYRDAKIVEGYPVREISADEARPADLLFWPGHVAVYLGDGLYIHSTGMSSGVVINSLIPGHPDYRQDLSAVGKWGSVF